MRDPDCIFCKIIAGELPSQTVDEDERTVAFMDINPATRGHFWSSRATTRGSARDRARGSGCAPWRPCTGSLGRVRAARRRGVNLLNSCGAAAWQTVFHFHVHVIPRYEADPLRLPWIPPGDPAEIEPRSARELR